MVTERELISYWRELSFSYMTEESDDPDDQNLIVQHKLPWRSESEYFVLYWAHTAMAGNCG